MLVGGATADVYFGWQVISHRGDCVFAKLSKGGLLVQLNLLCQREIVGSVARVIVPEASKNLATVVKVDARHLETVSTHSASTVAVQDACDESANPDSQTKQLRESAKIKAELPVQPTFRI